MLDQFFEEEEARAQENESIAVGIDLGTTNTVVAHADGRGPAVLRDEEDRPLLPSVVAYLPGGGLQVGHAARKRRLIDPANTITSAKRIIGQPFSSQRFQQMLDSVPYMVVEGENQESLVRTRAGDMSIPQISCHVVERAKEISEQATGSSTTHCVITVPANFNDAQREATRRAAKLAGLDVLRILNEPTAAALAYGHTRSLNERIAVFDMGGGTFDLSVLAVRRGLYEVLATGGDSFLGGDDMDHALTDELARRFLAEHRMDPRTNSQSLAKMMAAAEEIKIHLSDHDETEVHITELERGLDGSSLDLKTTITRAQLEELVEPIIARAMECATAVLADADILPQHVDEVLLVGGATQVPLVRRRVEALFGRVAQTDVDPMEVVALGAATHAQALFAPETIGRSQSQSIIAEDHDAPPEIALLLDVTSHPVGLATAGGYAEVLLPKNTQIPAEVIRFFSTAKDNQESVVLKVCQGANARFAENEALGQLTLEGLRPGPRGKVRIEVGFLIDADGLLQVTAKDQDTGIETQAVLSLFGIGDNDILEIED